VAVDDYKARGMLLAAAGTVNPDKTFQPASGTNVTTVSFVVPGASTAALIRGFGVEFSSLTGAKLELLDSKGQVLQTEVPQTDFVGVLLDDGRIAKARITGKPLDNFAYAEPAQDIDADGIAENDPDADGDGIPNDRDAFPLDKKESVDTDGDGIGDNKDTDDDNDGTPDATEARRGTDTKRVDTDGDGVNDAQDTCPLTPGDCSDVFPPVISKLAMRPAKFEKGSKHGTRVSFTLSEPATVQLRVLRVVGPRRPPVAGVIERDATSGVNFARFIGRIGGRDLKPGRYVLAASAADAAGHASFQQPRIRFTVLG
jgi:hypothetical protein